MISELLTAVFLSFFSSTIILNYKIGRLLNLSLASVFTAGAYICLVIDSPLAFPIAFVTGFAVGLMLFKVIEHLSIGDATIVSLGFAIAIEEAIRLSFRTSYYQIVVAEYFNLLGEMVTFNELVLSAILAIILLTFALIFTSKRGLELKFVESDWELAEIYGVRTEKIRLLSIAIPSGFICLSGSFLSPVQPLHPAMGWSGLITAVIIAAVAMAAGDAGIKKYSLTFPIALLYSFLVGWLP